MERRNPSPLPLPEADLDPPGPQRLDCGPEPQHDWLAGSSGKTNGWAGLGRASSASGMNATMALVILSPFRSPPPGEMDGGNNCGHERDQLASSWPSMDPHPFSPRKKRAGTANDRPIWRGWLLTAARVMRKSPGKSGRAHCWSWECRISLYYLPWGPMWRSRDSHRNDVSLPGNCPRRHVGPEVAHLKGARRSFPASGYFWFTFA